MSSVHPDRGRATSLELMFVMDVNRPRSYPPDPIFNCIGTELLLLNIASNCWDYMSGKRLQSYYSSEDIKNYGLPCEECGIEQTHWYPLCVDAKERIANGERPRGVHSLEDLL